MLFATPAKQLNESRENGFPPLQLQSFNFKFGSESGVSLETPVDATQ